MADRPDWHNEETYKFLLSLGQMAMRGAAIFNGGAAIALLAFMGDLLQADQIGGSLPTSVLRTPMLLFVFGLGLAGISTVCAYVMQLILFNEEMGRRGKLARLFRSHEPWLRAAVVTVTVSYVLFVAGALVAVTAFT